MPGSGIFLWQQNGVNYCCLSSQIPALLQGRSPPLLCSPARMQSLLDLWHFCFTRDSQLFTSLSPLLCPPSCERCRKYGLLDFGVVFQMCFALKEAWMVSSIWAHMETARTPQIHSHICGLPVDHPVWMHSCDPKAPFPGDLRVPRSHHGHVMPRVEPHPWVGMPKLALPPSSRRAAGPCVLAVGGGRHLGRPAHPG